MRQFIITMLILIILIQQIVAQYKYLPSMLKNESKLNIENLQTTDISPLSNQKKSVVLAVVASLILPGMGELYAGSFESGKYHLIAEGGLWLTYTGFRLHADWLKQDSRTYALQHAGANFENKDDQYPVNIGNFYSTDEYNQVKLRNREYDLLYTEEQYNWKWDADDNRLRFKNLRIRSDAIKNNSKFIIAAIVVNHLFSAFTAGRKAVAYNKSLTVNDAIQIKAYALNVGTHIDGIGLNITAKF